MPNQAPVSGGYPVHNQQGGYQQGGYQQGGYQQGGFPPQQGGFPAQQGGFPPQQGGFPPQQGGFPPQQGGFPPQQGGYPVQQGGFPVQQGYPAGQYPVQQQKSSGSGLQTALIAGVGGLALYGALKPSEEKTIIINNGVEQKPGDSSTTAATAAAAAVTPVNVETTATPLAGTPLAPAAATPIAPVSGAPEAVTPITPTSGSPVPPDPTGPTQTAPLAPFPSPATDINTMAPPGVPPYSGSTIYYDQVPLAPLPSDASSAPLAPFPSSIPPMCAPGQNPDDPLLKCTPLTVAPMYVTPSTVDGAQREASAIPVASNTNQNLQAQSALKSSAVSCFVVAFNIVMIPILTLLMV